MWEKPKHRQIEAVARPLRVAYLVDLDTCDDHIIDDIIAESYSRWSGRRTPIVPASPNGIASSYQSWLRDFDADIIYSFAELTDAAVIKIDEDLAPGFLVHHRNPKGETDQSRRYKIELPIKGLNSLSVLPMYSSRRWGFEDRPRQILTFDRFWDGSDEVFIRENLGFVSSSFHDNRLGDSVPELFTCMTLIKEGSLKNQRLRKSDSLIFECNPLEILRKLASHGQALSLCQLSEMFSHYLEPKNSLKSSGVNIVVGETIADRLAFWNGHNRFPRSEIGSITSLHISTDQANNSEFLGLIASMLDLRGVRDSQQSPVATIRSVSMSEEELEEIAVRLQATDKPYKRYQKEKLSGADWAVPKFHRELTHFITGGMWGAGEPRGIGKSDLANGRGVLPMATPWHLSESQIPPSLRSGQWMMDLMIERENDHCQSANVVHEWLLPRRLRIDSSFRIERDSASAQRQSQYCKRPLRSGRLSTSVDLSIHQASISVPEDDNALFAGLLDTRRNRFLRATGSDGRPRPGPAKVSDAKYSDKGRYLLGTLSHFSNLSDALTAMTHDFWRGILRKLGANQSHLDEAQEDAFDKVLARRLGANGGEWKVDGERDRQTVIREALKIASLVKRPIRRLTYAEILKYYEETIDRFLLENDDLNGVEIREDLFPRELDESLKYLCARRVIFQGHEWQCRKCFNRNWVSIDDLSTTLICNVCGSSTLPPVSGGWQFKASGFFVEAYRDHGTEPTLWALHRLHQRALRSFYFLPSTSIWFENYHEDRRNDCEIDLIAVVDGEIILTEATNSRTLKIAEVEKLVMLANRVRPDRLYIVCGAAGQADVDAISRKIGPKLDEGIALEIEVYQLSGHHVNPYLPS
jgi:hypothetical protein